jgi:hypothetical protein
MPVIRLGGAGKFDSSYAYMVSGYLCRPAEIWLYCAVSDHTHGNYDVSRDKFTGTISRAKLRLDGFVSLDANYAGGEFSTPPIVYSGRQLTLNLDASGGGSLRVEIQAESGLAMEGFSAHDCDPINGSFIGKAVSWRGKTDLSAMAGKAVRLRFVMNDTKLYAFKFE